ncbi:MAG: hypothetical protein ACTHOE_16015 [Conexibacter sp.]
MNDPLLAAIGADLQRAVRRRVARRRRRRVAITLTFCTVALVAVTGALAGGVDPLRLLPDIRGMAPPSHDVRRVDLTVEGHVGTWHVVAYRSRQGSLCTTGALDGGRPTDVGCGGGLAILPRRGLASLSFFRAHAGRRLVAGTVADDVDRVVVEDADGAHAAALSTATIGTPRLRLFAVELARHAHSGHWTRRQVLAAPVMRFRLHWTDGRTTVASGPPASG